MSVYLKWNQTKPFEHNFPKKKNIRENISIANRETLNEKSNGAVDRDAEQC